ncbi:hypothetical protein [Pseudozobellia thermophila]|uniref:Uncharacterized protein n=1 Tax=Pseudozobellia thermophila TaxID=192903 RepID=A0A1M6I996_9FLAO|nr:hypothetical protein [Pseudozobellia thermophila]SHJ31021.1 hypothetical protein SAMN04488513_103384 [Pseudozobellia thermophila]
MEGKKGYKIKAAGPILQYFYSFSVFIENGIILKKNIAFYLLLLMGSFASLGQNPKQRAIYYYAWNYPLIRTASNKIGFSIDEKPLTISAALMYGNGDKLVFLKSDKGKITIPSGLVKALDLWSYQTVPIHEAGIKVFLAPEPSVLEISTFRSKEGPGSEEYRYKGELKLHSGIKIEITDARGRLLHEKILEDYYTLYTINVHNNKSITSEKKALELTKAHFMDNVENYMAEANGAVSGPLRYKLVAYLQDVLDLRRKKESLYVYTFKKKKGFDFSGIQASIEDLKSLSDVELGADYQKDMEDLLLPKIDFWRKEISKYDRRDKRQVKVVWGLLANICGAYHALGAYEKALGVYKEVEGLDYRENYKYLKQLPEEKMAARRAFFGTDTPGPLDEVGFRGTHNPDHVHYENYRPHLLGTNRARIPESSLQLRQNRAYLLSKILGHYQYLEELRRLGHKFSERGNADVGFERTDAYYVEVFNRAAKESEELKYLDLAVLQEDEKVLATKIAQDLIDFYDVYNKEVSLNKESYNDWDEMQKILDKLLVVMHKWHGDEKEDKRALDKNMDLLCDKMLLVNDETLISLPLLETLLDELSSGDKVCYGANPKLFKQLFKKYQKTYISLFVADTSIKRHLHHSALQSLNKEIKVYYELYRADEDEIGARYGNLHDDRRVANILALFVK